ncbi:hypothetical protein C8F04DRAFT_1125425 [Mycena alexandri]|uniref:Uncharacterized protein n=1 Tax=Mycena alexandri TaxID=1745969 RepID=A0AAD6WWZ6_9AGAR|nr:hypothetical protein C8F04DRAFT_1125425 [Mycena alexandri]
MSMSDPYPTPRSSNDYSAWVRAPAPASKPVQYGPSPHHVGATTPRTGLHTPAASLEITSPAPPSKVTSAATQSEIDQLQLEKAAKLLSDIDKLQFETNRSQSLFVDVATWEVFEANHRESVEHRTEYVADTQTMIVTCASGVHEGFRPLVQPFTDVAATFRSVYTIETNIDVHVTSPLKARSNRVPDFVFAKSGVEPQNLFLFECAWSQPFTDVEKKAAQLLTRKDVQLVACLDITTGGQRPCKSAPPVKYTIRDADTFPDKPRARLAPVIFEKHVWAGAITGIRVHLFQRDFETESYDVFPGAPGLEDNQSIVGLAFGKLLTDQLKADGLSLFTSEKPFFIDWDGLYDNIDKRLISDGFQRYKDWAVKVADDPLTLPAVAVKRSRPRDDLKDLPEWYKKPKVEQ